MSQKLFYIFNKSHLHLFHNKVASRNIYFENRFKTIYLVLNFDILLEYKKKVRMASF